MFANILNIETRDIANTPYTRWVLVDDIKTGVRTYYNATLPINPILEGWFYSGRVVTQSV